MLTDDQIKFCDSNDLEKHILEKTGINLDSRSGSNGKDYIRLGKKLFLYPKSENDHDQILPNKTWLFSSNQMTSLENRNSFFILRGISLNEINKSSIIKIDLQKTNVKSWTALIENEPDHLAVKCETNTRANLSEILSNHFVEGKKYMLPNNKIALVRFDPDIQNPIQCFSCFKFDGHMAENCRAECQKCERCGEKRHIEVKKQLQCKNKQCCVNCGKPHGARDMSCEEFILHKSQKMQSQVHLITGKFLVRSPRTRRAHYADLVKKHSEGISVTDNFCKWKNDADSRVASVEKRCVNELNKVEGQFSEIKSRAGSFVDNMEEVLKKAYKAAKNITNTWTDLLSLDVK